VRLDGWVVYNDGAPYFFLGRRPTRENGKIWSSPSGPIGRVPPQNFPRGPYSTPQYVCLLTGHDAVVMQETGNEGESKP
jgi:hypothetical protein